MKISFLGATGTVTGSKYLVEIGSKHILIDCGLFQGFKQLRLRNWKPLPFPAREIDAVVLTHAHIDHSGYLPLLVRQGFAGRVYCTHATRELLRIVLPDSARLQEEEAAFANRRGYSKHHPALPLYTQQDAVTALEHLSAVDYWVRHDAEWRNRISIHQCRPHIGRRDDPSLGRGWSHRVLRRCWSSA